MNDLRWRNMADCAFRYKPATQLFYFYISTFRIIHFIIIIITIIVIIIIIIVIFIIVLSALIKFSPTGAVSSLPAKNLTTVLQVS